MKMPDFIAGKPRGTSRSLAKAVGVTPVTMWQWINGVKPVPIDRCPDIEAATKGAVTCEELRPDATWVRVPADWAWHVAGRPLLDVAAKREPALAC